MDEEPTNEEGGSSYRIDPKEIKGDDGNILNPEIHIRIIRPGSPTFIQEIKRIKDSRLGFSTSTAGGCADDQENNDL
jgi:hypothetical protein